MRPARRDRGALVTRTLLALGLGLLAVVLVALALRHPSRHRPTAAPTTPTAPTATAPTPPSTTTTAPAPPVTPGVTTTPFSVTVSWQTPGPTTGRVAVAYGGGVPTLWSAPVGPARDHTATVGGLALDSDYEIRAPGRSLTVHTPLASSSLVAATGSGAVLLDGQPFFPLMVWGECPSAYGPATAAGINLFAENPCGGADAQVDALGGKALSAGIAGDADWQNPSLIGWFYPDEADARSMTGRMLPPLPPSSEVGRVSFLTLSNHVFARASPPPLGRRVYAGLIARADVVGFDLYPLQEWCSPDVRLVYQAQRDLVAIAGGRPTFQWIEAGPMRCRNRPGTTVTPRIVRAESLLAVVGGAHGLGFFPGEWSPAITDAITRVTGELKAVAPALLGPGVGVSANGGLVASGHALNDALYVVAVNPSRRASGGRLAIVGAGDRSFDVLGESRSVTAHDGVLEDRFPPLAARIYVAAPPG